MSEAEKQLREHQQQLDADGVMVGVSRQALVEFMAENKALREELQAEVARLDEIVCNDLTIITRLEAENKDLDAALVQSVINDAQRLRQLKELGQRLTEAIQLLHKDADWFDLNKQEQRAAELRDRLTALQEAGVK